jgi:ABC-2 type transport system permease protein
MKAPSHDPASAGPTPLAPSWWHALGGTWRLTARRLLLPMHWAAVGGALVVLALICLGFLSAGNGPRLYVGWTITFYFTFLVPVIATINAGGVMRDEMKPSTVDYVLVRPLPRPAFVAFKYLSHVACAQVDFLCAFAVVIALGSFRGAPGLLAAAPDLLLAQVVLVTAFSGLGFLAGAVTSRYVIVAILYGVLIEFGIGQIPTQLHRLSMTHQVKAMLQPLVAGVHSPFTVTFDSLPPAAKLPTVALMLGFAAATLAIAAAVFSGRELTGPSEP